MQCISIVDFDERRASTGWYFPNITRPFSIIYYVIDGTAYYTFEDQEKSFKKGHLYILPANRVFSLRDLPTDKLLHMYIHAYTFPEINEVVEIDISSDEFISDTVGFLRSYVKKGKSAMIYVHRLTDMLIEYISKIEFKEDVPLYVRIKEYTEENYVSVFKGNDLSQKFNYSNSYITKLFRSKYDTTPKQYAKRLILQEIISLLKSGTSVADIARRLSFSSPENLCRFFKSVYGCAPSEYIRRFNDFPL